MARQAPRQVREEFLRGRIDPVHVLDDEDEEGGLARAEEHLAQQLVGPLLELRAGQAIEEFRRGGDAEEVGEQDDRVLSLQAEELELVGHPVSDLVAGDPFVESEVAPQ